MKRPISGAKILGLPDQALRIAERVGGELRRLGSSREPKQPDETGQERLVFLLRPLTLMRTPESRTSATHAYSASVGVHSVSTGST